MACCASLAQYSCAWVRAYLTVGIGGSFGVRLGRANRCIDRAARLTADKNCLMRRSTFRIITFERLHVRIHSPIRMARKSSRRPPRLATHAQLQEVRADLRKTVADFTDLAERFEKFTTIQLERIAQIQVELDEVRFASTKRRKDSWSVKATIFCDDTCREPQS